MDVHVSQSGVEAERGLVSPFLAPPHVSFMFILKYVFIILGGKITFI